MYPNVIIIKSDAQLIMITVDVNNYERFSEIKIDA